MTEICHVCGQPLNELYAVSCTSCGRKVHFRSTDVVGEDCAHIVTQLFVCGLSFICSPCHKEASAQSRSI